MAKKTTLKRDDSADWYKLESELVDVYLSHTTAGASVLTNSLSVGKEFRDQIGSSVGMALERLSASNSSVREALMNPGTLTILRGGLNFDLNDAIERVVNVPPEASFMTSQRAVQNGEALVTDDSYRRYNLAGSKSLIIGDIAATGRTICNALTRIASDVKDSVSDLEIVIVVVGTRNFLARFEKFVESEIGQFYIKRGCRFSVIFLESIFSVFEGLAGPLGRLTQTDFIRYGSTSTPGYLKTSLQSPIGLLERCTIYDGGVRSFEPRVHLRGLRNYWSAVRALVDFDRSAFDEFVSSQQVYKRNTNMYNPAQDTEHSPTESLDIETDAVFREHALAGLSTSFDELVAQIDAHLATISQKSK